MASELSDEEMEEIEELQSLMDANTYQGSMAAQTRVGPNSITAGSPSEFFARTLLRNPGALSIKAVSTFADRMLDLPGVADRNGTGTSGTDSV